MSWNIAIRLNNMQRQIDNIANEGLTNPLEQNILCNGYSINDITTLNGGANVININTDNAGGIVTNKKITVNGDLTCNTLNYTALNPPIEGKTENLEEVLTNGNDAGGLNMNNIGFLEAGIVGANTIRAGTGGGGGSFPEANTLQVCPSGGGNCFTLYEYGSGDTDGDFYANGAQSNGNFMVQQYKAGVLFNNLMVASEDQELYLQTEKLERIKPSVGQIGNILDTYYNSPIYKQVYNSISGSANDCGIQSYIFGVEIYKGSTLTNYGIKYAELLFSNFNITFTSPSAFPTGLTATLFLTNDQDNGFNGALGNSIVIPVNNDSEGLPNCTFNSTVPIVFYYYNNGTDFNTAYFNVVFSSISLNTYDVQMANCNLLVTSYVSQNIGGGLEFKNT